MAFLKRATCYLPIFRFDGICEIEGECFLYATASPDQVLELNIRRLLSATFPAETIERRNDIFQRVSDEVAGHVFIQRLREPELLVGELEIFLQNLERIMNTAVG